jgi:alkylation response protein AidB-like acyl-CoA dehydrogenase
MTGPDEHLSALRGQMREWAADFRERALELDADPDAVARHLDLPGLRYLSTARGLSARERAVVMEELGCGDAAMLLAAPGPSMSGVLVDLLGDEPQRDRFHARLADRPTWTFFALTEPGHGSDANALATTLGPDGRLTGAKRYVGNATRASFGVVFARTRPGPLGVTAVLVDTGSPGYGATALPMLGLRGARFAAITLSDVEVAPEDVLGRHRSPAQRGMWAAVQTFNRLRPGVAALALGIARAAYEYARLHRSAPSRAQRCDLDALGRRIDGTRALIDLAAATVDARGSDGHLASAAKARACRLAEEATLAVCRLFGPGARLEHPLLDKLARDARGVEFMEGTANIQKLNLFQGLLMGKMNLSAGAPAGHRT